MTGEGPRSLVVTAAAGELRRSLGPTSWIVLEELLLHSDETRTACVSVRALAASLGLAMGTVARAVRHLRDLGLATPAQDRDRAGQFTAGSYSLNVTPAAVAVTTAPVADAPAPTSAPRRRTRPRRTVHAAQLALLDAD
jgi:hypothetical protein